MRRQHSISKLKYLTPIECVELEQNIEKKKTQQTKDAHPTEYRNAIMIELLYRTGMRSSEMLLMRPMDLYDETQSIQVATVKGGKDREIPIQPELFRLLQSISTGDREDRIWTMGHRNMLEVWKQFRPVKKKLHSLRHTYAYNLYKRSKDLLLCKRALGHRSINSTMVYQEEYYQQADLNRLLEIYD